MSSKQIRVGQRWRRHDGSVVTIEEDDLSDRDAGVAPIRADGNWYSRAGKAYSIGACDLVELIEDAPGEPQQQASTPFAVGMEGVKTRDGRNVRILATDLKEREGCIVAAITCKDGTELLEIFHENGNWSRDGTPNDLDLMPPAPPKQYVWVNVYRDVDFNGKLYAGGGNFGSKVDAKAAGYGSGNYVGCLKVELEARWDE